MSRTKPGYIGHPPWTSTQEPTLSIGAVERDTGLSKDTLRVWERRYGFPAPQRDASGERCYLRADLHKLRIVKRLLDAGQRPGRIVRLPLEALQQLAQPAAGAGRSAIACTTCRRWRSSRCSTCCAPTTWACCATASAGC